jgi:hypothetical protein
MLALPVVRAMSYLATSPFSRLRAEYHLTGAEASVVTCCFPSTAIVTARDDDGLSVEVAGGVAGRDGELAEEETHGR